MKPGAPAEWCNTAGVNRRDFLGALGVAGAAIACRPALRESVDDVLAIDMHNHVYPAGTEPHPHQRPGEPPMETLPLGEALARSGLTAVCASFVLDFADGDPRDALLGWMKAIDAQLAAGGIKRALSVADLRRGPAIVQSVEGAMFVEGQLDRIDEVYQLGMRHLQLFHERDDARAPLGDVNTREAHLGGLTPVGADVIRACNRRGILVDLAHASAETVAAAVAVSTKPMIISHTSLDTFGAGDRMHDMMKPRLISKDHAKVIADAGGIVGVWTHLTRTLPEYVESIRAMVDAIGVEHVGLGTDTDLLSSRGTDSLFQPSFVRAVADEMRRQGFTADAIAKIAGGNYLRVFGEAVG